VATHPRALLLCEELRHVCLEGGFHRLECFGTLAEAVAAGSHAAAEPRQHRAEPRRDAGAAEASAVHAVSLLVQQPRTLQLIVDLHDVPWMMHDAVAVEDAL
jgi:hypothetical protein